jgi:hypothetical protein
MKRGSWLIFGAIQAAGIMAAIDAVFLQFPSLLLVMFLLLLPGSLLSAALFWRSGIAADWSLWAMTLIAVITNAILFSIATFLVTRYRRSK